MDIALGLLGLIVWIALGYTIFYFRYVDRKLVDDLRKTISELHHELQTTWVNTKEFEQQNRILKEKVTELLLKNDDLTKITSELYRYYHRIKEWYAKATELVELLKSFDKEFDEKIKIAWEIRQIPIQTMSDVSTKRF
jgi:uncharacterized membrane-anchored protein YhcB (DUF1043 family)